MSKVIARKADYRYEDLKPLIYAIMDDLGGEKVGRGTRVLIKPNLLSAAKPKDAVVTHALVVKAVTEYVLDKGGFPQISDSPAIGSFQKIMKRSGIREAVSGLEVRCSEFRESLPVDIGAPFGVIDLARDALEADMIVNLPKLKTHDLMLLTLGVKNMFGCVVGLRKPEWHMRMGTSREMFARLLVQIHQRLKPTITLLDGILAMEGEGPGKRGTPRRLDMILAGSDAFAVDAAVCRILNLDPARLPTLKWAKDLGLLDEVLEIDGHLPEIGDFKFPLMSAKVFGPRSLQGLIRRRLLSRPVRDRDQCQVCGKCWDLCPAGAISQDTRLLHFDYERCIRCYCCIEVCPEGALHTVEPMAGRLLRKVIRAGGN